MERDAASVTKISECGEQEGITASFENASDRNETFHELTLNDEIRGHIPDEARELPFIRRHFHRQPHTHHSTKNWKDHSVIRTGLSF